MIIYAYIIYVSRRYVWIKNEISSAQAWSLMIGFCWGFLRSSLKLDDCFLVVAMVNDRTRKKEKGVWDGRKRKEKNESSCPFSLTFGCSIYMYNTCIICLLQFNEANVCSVTHRKRQFKWATSQLINCLLWKPIPIIVEPEVPMVKYEPEVSLLCRIRNSNIKWSNPKFMSKIVNSKFYFTFVKLEVLNAYMYYCFLLIKMWTRSFTIDYFEPEVSIELDV
jgi:hypothetical protein